MPSPPAATTGGTRTTQLVLENWETAEELPFDEHRLALQQLIAAVDLRSQICGGVDAKGQARRERCSALLER